MIRDRIRDMADSAGTSLGDVMEQYSQLYYGIQALRNGTQAYMTLKAIRYRMRPATGKSDSIKVSLFT